MLWTYLFAFAASDAIRSLPMFTAGDDFVVIVTGIPVIAFDESENRHGQHIPPRRQSSFHPRGKRMQSVSWACLFLLVRF